MGIKKQLKQVRKLAAASTKLLPEQEHGPARQPSDLAVLFGDAWDRRDADAIAALFADDADFINVVGLWWTSRLSIERSHRMGFERIFGRSTLTLDSIGERRLGESAAVVTVKWTLEGQLDPEGDPADTRVGIMSFVAAKLADGSWLAVHAQNTDAPFNADTMMARDNDLRPTSYIPVAPDVVLSPDEEARLAGL